jgi:hypothetical protein
MGELLRDGLFALDAEGLLLPGVAAPEKERNLCNVYLRAWDSAAGMEPPEPDSVYQEVRGKRRVPLADIDRMDDLTSIAVALGVAMLRQRMLIARLNALAEELAVGEPPVEKTRKEAKAAKSAADRLITVTHEVLNSILGPYPSQ